MKRFSFIFLITFGLAAQAQIVNIPDANFKNALLNEIVADFGVGYFSGPVDTNGDGEIQVSEAQAVFGLKVNDFHINSLEGIQSFINLKKLECDNNNISNLDLSQNLNLKELDCNINQLRTLSLSQNFNLERIACAGNIITSLDVTQHPNLVHLVCHSNQLSTLNLSQNPLLKSLDASYNQLTSLDVLQNPNLEVLYCGSPYLVSLDVSQNPRLELFGFRDSNLTSIDVTNNPDLRWLYCENNNLTALDLSQNDNFERLFASGNQLTSLNLKNGNNQNLNIMRADNNPNLTCIQIDDLHYANAQRCYQDNWCKDETATYSENCSMSIMDMDYVTLTLFPNPVQNILNVNLDNVIERVQILSVNGNIIIEVFDVNVDVSMLESGIYFARIYSNGKSNTKKFIKN